MQRFANGGYRAVPRGLIDVRTTSGKLVYDAAADAPPRQRVLSEQDGARHDRHDARRSWSAAPDSAPASPASTSPARPARPMPTATPGSSASPATSPPRCGSATTTTQPTDRLTGGILPAATWAKYMRVAMAYEKPIPLPGLPPPEPTLTSSSSPTRPAARVASTRAPPAGSHNETSDALGRLEERFRKATAEAPMRQASLGPSATAAP